MSHSEKLKSDPEYASSWKQSLRQSRANAKAVEMLDQKIGSVIACFDKLMDAAAWVRGNTSYSRADYATINKVCKGKGKTAYGYRWRYRDG